MSANIFAALGGRQSRYLLKSMPLEAEGLERDLKRAELLEESRAKEKEYGIRLAEQLREARDFKGVGAGDGSE
jgi:hypothetical protein